MDSRRSLGLNSSTVSTDSSVTSQSMLNSLFQFNEQVDVLLTVSRAIFEDFQRYVSQGAPFREVLHYFLKTCDNGIGMIRQVLNAQRRPDPNLSTVLKQLCRERNTYDLLLKQMDADAAAEEEKEPSSHLQKLFAEDPEFRRLLTLLRWSEEMESEQSGSFSKACNDTAAFDDTKTIFAYAEMRGAFPNLDTRFTGEKLIAEDLETALRLHEVLFGFIRSGRLDAANELLERIEQTSLSMFLVFREMLVNPELTPMDDLSDNYPLARSRLLFKALARELITVENDNVTKFDQCTWAALSGALSPLLTHAACSEDRLWSFVTCAVDARLDDELVKAQNIQDEAVVSMRRAEEDVPKDVASIFSELGNYETCPYFKLYGYLASDDWARAVHYLDSIVQSDEHTITAHQMRFFAHFILLTKCAGQQLSDDVGERVLSKFIDILIELNLYSLVPFYLSQLQPDLAHRKTVDFLYGIENEAERKEALAGAAEAGFDASALCRDVYAKAKRMNPFTEDEDQVARSAVELIRSWKWLTYYEAENIFDALVEANALIRKLFLHNRIAEATELMTTSSVNLTVAAETVFQQQFGDAPRPVSIVEANKEYCSYVMYFEGVEKYNTWLQHVESPAPELPVKLTDEQWARLDLKRRAEYELSIKKSRDSLQKYLRVTDALKKNAVELLENILRQSEVWLTSLPGDEKSEKDEVRQRAQELAKIRSAYMFYVIRMLIGVYRRTNDHGKVLGVARLLVDFRYDLQKALSKDDLRSVIDLVSQSGATLLESA